MDAALRHFVMRRCPVCDWTNASLESEHERVDCPQCHAPVTIEHDEWLVSVAALQAEAVRHGRLGGVKGGRIRAERLSAARRREIARKAAAARWRRR